MTAVCVIQARMGSSRLPGKVLMDLVPGEPALQRVVTRVSRATTIDRVIVATTVAPEDDAIEEYVAHLGVTCTRGDVHDVLSRYKEAVDAVPAADVVVRVTADCPFVDPDIIDYLVSDLRSSRCDYVSNRLPPPYARTYPVGLDVEVMSRDALERAAAEAISSHQREHVTPYLYENMEVFAVKVHDLAEDLSGYRWTLDTPADLDALRELARLAGPEPYGWEHILEVARAHPEIGELNRQERQKAVTEVDERNRRDR